MITESVAWWVGIILALAGTAVTFAAMADGYAGWGWLGVAAGLSGIGMAWRASIRP